MTGRVVGVVGWLAVSLAGWRAGRLAVLLVDWFNDRPSETTKVGAAAAAAAVAAAAAAAAAADGAL